MTDRMALECSDDIDRQALLWASRRDRGDLTEQERTAFERWLMASPRHRAAYDEIDELWNLAGEVAGEIGPAEPVAAANDRGSSSMRWMAAAAALFVAVGTSFWALSPASIETKVGEQRVVMLADHSRVTLNTGTVLTPDFSDDRRIVELAQGEALFEVAHDADRPFIVRSPYGSVRAVGTKFVVRIEDDRRLKVIVTEGRVLVDRKADAARVVTEAPTGEPVAAGEALQLTAKGRAQLAELQPQDMQRQLAWRTGDIFFDSVPLPEAVAEMQRYSGTKIEVDERVAAFKVGGHFRTADLSEFLEVLQTAFPVSVRHGASAIEIVPSAQEKN